MNTTVLNPEYLSMERETYRNYQAKFLKQENINRVLIEHIRILYVLTFFIAILLLMIGNFILSKNQ